MNEIENKTLITQPQQPEEQEIDLMELAQKVWAERKLILKTCGYAFLIGIVVAVSIPKEYTTDVTLAPEATGSKGGGGMGALAAMAGINLGSNNSGGDALSVDFYPEIVSSTPFLTDLFDIRVTDKKGKIETTLYDYLKEHQQSAWWGYIFSSPFKALGWVMSLFKEEEPEEDGNLNLFMLTKDEAGIVKNLSDRITVSVDKKTGITTLSVIMQDPLISATVTNVVIHNLQNYITDYRTNKVRHDLEFTEKLFKEAKEDYDIAQQEYAKYMDENRNTILQTARIEEERLADKKNLTYNVYKQIAQQLQMAKAKVQEITPVYTVVQPATVSLKPSKPNKMLILVGFLFLGGVGSVGWILFVKELLKTWKEKQVQEYSR
jgi:uncharacterized protein involved in exopolysaccharide biosynthesis